MAGEATGTGPIRVSVVTPERAALDVHADFVVLPLYDGEFGVGRDHAAFVGVMGPGEFRYTSGGVTHRYYVDGGFAQVRTNVVTMLTARATPAAGLSVAATDEARQAAELLPAATTAERTSRDKAVARAAAMGRVAAKN